MRNRALTDQDGIALAYVDASADRQSAIVDTLDWQGVKFMIHIHATAASATCTYKLQESDDSGMSGATDVPQATLSITDSVDAQLRVLDYASPQKRYVQLDCNKNGSNNVADSATYSLYGPKVKQTADTATVTRAAVRAAVGLVGS